MTFSKKCHPSALKISWRQDIIKSAWRYQGIMTSLGCTLSPGLDDVTLMTCRHQDSMTSSGRRKCHQGDTRSSELNDVIRASNYVMRTVWRHQHQTTSSWLNDVISASNNFIRTEWRHQHQTTSSGLNDVISTSNIVIRTEWRHQHVK